MKDMAFIKNVAMTASLMAEHVSEKLYLHLHSVGHGYVATHEQIAEWALCFEKKHRNTNWDEVLEREMKPLSSEVDSIFSKDDAVIDYACYKMERMRELQLQGR